MKAKQVPATIRALVYNRAGGTCELDGQRDAEQIHHRVDRGMGGSRAEWMNLPGNLVAICGPCHEEITRPTKVGMTKVYEAAGWLVRRGITPPEHEPILIWHGGVRMWALLDNEGGVTRSLEAEVEGVYRSMLLAGGAW